MTFEELLEKVELLASYQNSESAAELAFDFGRVNEITPADQDALEDAVIRGAEKHDLNSVNETHFFVTELDLLAGGCEPISARGNEFS